MRYHSNVKVTVPSALLSSAAEAACCMLGVITGDLACAFTLSDLSQLLHGVDILSGHWSWVIERAY